MKYYYNIYLIKIATQIRWKKVAHLPQEHNIKPINHVYIVWGKMVSLKSIVSKFEYHESLP